MELLEGAASRASPRQRGENQMCWLLPYLSARLDIGHFGRSVMRQLAAIMFSDLVGFTWAARSVSHRGVGIEPASARPGEWESAYNTGLERQADERLRE